MLPREALQSLSLEIFNQGLDVALGSALLTVTGWCFVTDLVMSEVSSQLMDSVIYRAAPGHVCPHSAPLTLNRNAENTLFFFFPKYNFIIYMHIYTHTTLTI